MHSPSSPSNDPKGQSKSASTINSASISPMVRLSRRETFSASHRLHNSGLSDEENQQIYSKCNNPNGHGHNYVVYVVLQGPIDKRTGMVYNLTDMKREIGKVLGIYSTVSVSILHTLDTLDHKNLDLDVEYFK